MNFINYNSKQLPIRFDHYAIRQIFAKFNLKNVSEFQSQLDSILTDFSTHEYFLRIGLERGAKSNGEQLNITDEDINEILNQENIVGDITAILSHDIFSVFQPSKELLERMGVEKKTKNIETSTSTN